MPALSATSRFQDPTWLTWERACLERIRRGDRDAFAELYRAFARPLYAQVLLPRLGAPAAAEEALAETFRSALEKLHTFQPGELSVWHWLTRIAANKATDLHRERARTHKALTSFLDLLGPLAPPSQSPEGELERARRHERLQQAISNCLGRINPRYRRAIELRLLQERERADCAAQLGVTVPTFDVILLRALRAFRQEWAASPAAEELL